MSHLDDEALVLRLYGEDDGPAAGVHLASCPACRERLATLQGDLLALTGSSDIPDPGPDYGSRVWMRLADRLDEPSRARRVAAWWQAAFSWPRLALAGGLAVVVVGAFLAGRAAAPRPEPSAVPATTAAASPAGDPRQRVFLVAVGDHLDRSRVVLAELVRGSEHDGIGERGPDTAADLVATNRLYRQSAMEGGDPALAGVLEELERVLVEMANAADAPSKDGVARLRERVETQGLLFKVTVLGSQVRQRQQEAAVHASASRRSAT